MGETELEEGEACSYGNDLPVDPDVSLSYIDEKLQNVLGHLQKDFEGGVSAENLGAKFGGYGSFLPTHQRSPILSRPRTPQNGQNQSPFPNYFQLQEGNHNSAIPTSVPLPVKHGPETVGIEPLLANRASSECKSTKRDVCMLPAPTKGLNFRYEIAKNSSNPQEKKMPKLRIKMGSDNLSTRKKDSIYSGLGLEISPSSSVGDSPAVSKDLSHKSHEGPLESPNTILRIMTTFQIPGGILLSPLSDDLKLLAHRGKARGDKGSIPRGGRGSSVCLVNDCAEKVLDQNNRNSTEKEKTLLGIRDGTGKDAHNGVAGFSVSTSQNEGDIDASACKDTVSKKLKLPFLSTSHFTSDDPVKNIHTVVDASRAKDGVIKDMYNDDPAMDSTHMKEFGHSGKQNELGDPAGKSGENRLENFNEDDGINPRKGTMGKKDKLKVGSSSSKGTKAPKIDKSHSSKSKNHLKATTLKQNGKYDPLPSEDLSFDRKKKSKVSQNHNTLSTLTPQEDLKVGSFSVPKANKKDIPFVDPGSKIESGKIRLQKGSVNASDRYRDFFGDLSPEQDIEVDSFRMPFEETLRETEVTSSSRYVSGESKVRFNGKKDEKHLVLQAPSEKRIAQISPAVNGMIPEGTHAKAAPEVIEEHWVSCDKCQKWRLLPFGTNPDSLPEKWVCSMLNWLPGMNRCSFSEDETTNALTSLYQVPVAENQTNFHGQPEGALRGLAQDDIQHSGQNHRRLSYHAEATSFKKRQGSTGVSNASVMQEPTGLKISMKSLQPSAKSRSLNEKQKHDKKEKHGLLEQLSDAGDKKKSKARNHKGAGQDNFRALKKLRVEGKHDNGEGWVSGTDRHFRNGGSSSTDILPTFVASKDHPKYNCSSSWKDSDFYVNESLPVAAGTTNDQSRYSIDHGSHEIGKLDTKRFLMKKRKLKDSENYRELNSTRQLVDIVEPVKEGFSANDDRKKKKSRLTTVEMVGGRDGAGIGKKEKISRSAKDQKLGPATVSNLSQGIVDGMNTLNRDIVTVAHSLPATSSSSKVSDSSRNITKLQDVEGSPVESVSSSPLRFPSKRDHPLNDRNSVEKDDFNVGFATEVSPRRCIDENDRGSDRSGTDSGKDGLHTVNYHGSLESSVLDIQELDRRHLSKDKAKEILVASSNLKNDSLSKDANNSIQLPGESLPLGRCDEELRSSRNYHSNELLPRKSANGSSRSKDKIRTSKSNFDRSNPSGSLDESEDYVPSSAEKTRDRKNRFQQNSGGKSCKAEKISSDRRDSAGILLDETSKLRIQSKPVSRDALLMRVALLAPKQILAQGKKEGSSTTSLSEKAEKVEVGCGRTTSTLEFVSAGANQNDNWTSCSQRSSVHLGANGADLLSVDPSKDVETMKMSKQATKCDKQTGDQHITSRHPTPNGHRLRDLDAPSPLLRDASSHAATIALREAQKLKHTADRLKNSESGLEATRLYFEASLKFLDAASLYESGNNESAKHGDLAQSGEIYYKTAKLCEFCALEFERSRDLGTASLAYKCTEIAYLRVIYSLSNNAIRDRAELQNNLHNILPGESPSSSASDVDNLNNVASVDKVTLVKDVSSPQVAGNQVIPARNRPTFERLLNFIRDTNCALEASKKSWSTFEAANGSLGQTRIREEGISSVKRALDFSFHDVEGFVRLVRLAMEALGR